MRLSEIYEQYREEEFQAKLAAVEEAWGDDEYRMELLDAAVDVIKEASAGDEPLLANLDAADTLSLAANLVEEFVKKEAEAPIEEDYEYEIVEELGKLAHEILAEALAEQGHDIDPEEFLDKHASTEEEQEEIGRWLAREVYERLQSVEY
jgi:hypothetical protein